MKILSIFFMSLIAFNAFCMDQEEFEKLLSSKEPALDLDPEGKYISDVTMMVEFLQIKKYNPKRFEELIEVDYREHPRYKKILERIKSESDSSKFITMDYDSPILLDYTEFVKDLKENRLFNLSEEDQAKVRAVISEAVKDSDQDRKADANNFSTDEVD